MSSLYEKKNNTADYVKTFFTTLFIVLTFGVLNIFYMIHSIFSVGVSTKTQNIDSAFEAYIVDMLIDKNEDFLKKDPQNYAIDMRLGILYSYKRNYIDAEKHFKNSIEKASVYDYTPSYQLSKMYIKLGRLQDAQQLMDKIGDKPNKRLIKFKGEVYLLLGDAYYNNGYYTLSVMKYERALSYLKLLDKKLSREVSDKYVKASIALADKYVETGKPDDAVMALENAYELKPKDLILNYKLGILYVDNDPYKAYDLLSFVLKKDPQQMNYDLYTELLKNISNAENQKGNYTNAELYEKKSRQYKKFVKNNIIYPKDLFINIVKSDIKTDIAAQEFIYTLSFTLQNNSDLDIEKLNINVIVKDGNNVIQNYNHKIYDEIKILKKGETSPPIIISASEPYKNRLSGSLSVDVYAYKYPKYSVKLYSSLIAKPPVKD